jgi:hypothetical protein
LHLLAGVRVGDLEIQRGEVGAYPGVEQGAVLQPYVQQAVDRGGQVRAGLGGTGEKFDQFGQDIASGPGGRRGGGAIGTGRAVRMPPVIRFEARPALGLEYRGRAVPGSGEPAVKKSSNTVNLG